MHSPAFIGVTLLALLASAGVTIAQAHEYKTGSLVLHHPWTRATPAGASVAGGYLTVENDGTDPDTLVGGSLSRASGFEIHQMAVVDGVMTMRPLQGGLEVAAGQSVKLEPGGLHLMFPGLKEPLKQGERVAGTLIFERAGAVAVEFIVDALAAKGGDHDHAP